MNVTCYHSKIVYLTIMYVPTNCYNMEKSKLVAYKGDSLSLNITLSNLD